jgi:hypothetical protein
MIESVFFSTAYLPPIQYFVHLLGNDEINIERCENFVKQSYRNRCRILSGNGILPLIIPILKSGVLKTPVNNVRPDYSLPWQKLHLISIQSAYGSAPFFDDYAYRLNAFYSRRYDTLFELNHQLFTEILNILGLKINVIFTEEFHSPGSELLLCDYRYSIHPKIAWDADPKFYPQSYYQVFNDRFGFVPNMSIVDLIFNEGPNALEIIRKSTLGSVQSIV